jgi:CheY-like chemotaxis protein
MFGKRQPVVDPLKERVARHLRAADELVRRKQFDDAILEIERANKLDPKNLYARSFLERTRFIAQQEHEQQEKVFGESDMLIERRMETISQLLASAEEFIKTKKYQRALSAVAKVYKIDPKNYYAQAFSERIDLLMQEDASGGKSSQLPQPDSAENPVPAAEEHSPSVPSDSTVSIPNTKVHVNVSYEPCEEPGGLSMYRQLLKECWVDGIVTPEESTLLEETRSHYGISEESHNRIESEIKIEAFIDALRIIWRDDVISDNEQEVLEIMRKKYGITSEEQVIAEKKFSNLQASRTTKTLMLIVDSNQNDCISVALALSNQGHEVKLTHSPDEAVRFLSTHTPDLILCEAVFPHPNTDGFEFYHKVHSIRRLNHIPFIMMTSPSDARIIRAGLRMGVDYFIPKPLHVDYVVAVVEGKLKSGRQGIPN